MNTSYMVTARGHLQNELPICLLRGIGVCVMGLPFFASRRILHIGSSVLLGGCFALAFDRIERFLPISNRQEGAPSTRHEMCTEGAVLSKLVFRLLLTIPSLLLGFKILSPICGPYIPIRHDLSSLCGIIQLCVSVLIALLSLLFSTGKEMPYVEIENFILSLADQNVLKKQLQNKSREAEEARENVEELTHLLDTKDRELNDIKQKAETDKTRIEELTHLLERDQKRIKKAFSAC